MPQWSVSALFATVCLCLHYLTLRAASGKISDVLGALCVEAAAAAGVLALLILRAGQGQPTSGVGVFWSCVSGLAIAGLSVGLFIALRQGAPVSGTGMLVYGGGMALAAVVAPFIFNEPFTLRRALGVMLGFASLVVLATERR